MRNHKTEAFDIQIIILFFLLCSIFFSSVSEGYSWEATTDVIIDKAGQYEMGVCSL